MKKVLWVCLVLVIGAVVQAANPLFYGADPSGRVWSDGQMWIYPTTDKSNWDEQFEWHAWSSSDLVNWTDHGVIFDLRDSGWATGHAWAPDILYKNGTYYFYYYAHQGHPHGGVGVAVSDKPEGPFKEALGHVLVRGHDPGLFMDDDGQSYIYLQDKVYRLNEDMISLKDDGQPLELDYRSKKFEAVYVFKRQGIYYYTIADGFNHLIYYMGKSPLGPFRYKGELMGTYGGNNHHSILPYNGKWIMWYHGWVKPHNRRVRGEYLHFNSDGTIVKVPITDQGVGPEQVGTAANASVGIPAAGSGRPRLIILADMGNEKDEEQQMMHMLMYCNEFDLEGLVAVTGKYLNENSKNAYKRVVHPELFHQLVNGYEKVYPNLCLHAQGWPTAEHLRALVASGQQRYGIADTGLGKSSAGSKLIVKALLKDDMRPLNIVVNAGSNTLAQALIDLRNHTDSDTMARLVSKLRVYENGAQDNAGAWICHEFPSIHWVRSNYQTYCYMDGGDQGDNKLGGPYCWEPYPRTFQGQHRWAKEHVMTQHGALGELYPYRFNGNSFLEGGGTCPWIGLVNKGLYDPDHPSWGGWGGRFTKERQVNVMSRHSQIRKDEEAYKPFAMFTEAEDRWTDPEDGQHYEGWEVPIWRWRRAMLEDFKGRMDWCVRPYAQANHNPIAAVNGDSSNQVVELSVQPGETVMLDGSASSDPDGDTLSFRWFEYPEAGSCPKPVSIESADRAKARILVPAGASGQIHVVLEVCDQSSIAAMRDYRRIVITVH